MCDVCNPRYGSKEEARLCKYGYAHRAVKTEVAEDGPGVLPTKG